VVILAKGAKVPPLTVPSPALNPPTDDPGGAPDWWGGRTPVVSFNLANAAPSGGTVVKGRRTVSSGVVNGNAPKFTVTFARTGTFTIRCAVHPRMSGTVRVVRRGRRIPPRNAEDRAGGHGHLRDGRPKRDPHRDLRAGGVRPEGRRLVLPYSPANPAFGSEALYPSDDPALGPPPVTATAHGNGFVNSGALNDKGAGTLPRRFTVTFPAAGTDRYICLVHPFMQGTIAVG
jgi:plastocyanin